MQNLSDQVDIVVVGAAGAGARDLAIDVPRRCVQSDVTT
jgi:hypothetical protein